MKLGKWIQLTVCALLVMTTVGCARRSFRPITQLSSVRPPTFVEKVINKKVSAAVLRSACEQTAAVQALRMVAVYQQVLSGQPGLPEYRLFDVRKQSPYAVVGLETADVLLAANDYVLYEPEKFRTYVCLLAAEKTGWMNIRRGGVATKVVVAVE